MKKIISFFLVLFVCISLTGCKKDEEKKKEEKNSNNDVINDSREKTEARVIEAFANSIQNAMATRMSKPGYNGEKLVLVQDGNNYYVKIDGIKDENQELVIYSGNKVSCQDVSYDKDGYIALSSCISEHGSFKFNYCNAPKGKTCQLSNDKTMESTEGAAIKIS